MTDKPTKKKPKIDEKRWAEIVRRFVVGGESASALARELGVTEGAIRKRAGTKRYEAKEVANQILTAHENYSRLPESTKNLVDDMVAILRGVSSNLASAAMAGTATSARLAAIANKQAQKIDESNPMDTAEELQAIGALTKLSNEAAQIGVALLNANKEKLGEAEKGSETPTQRKISITVRDASR